MEHIKEMLKSDMSALEIVESISSGSINEDVSLDLKRKLNKFKNQILTKSISDAEIKVALNTATSALNNIIKTHKDNSTRHLYRKYYTDKIRTAKGALHIQDEE